MSPHLDEGRLLALRDGDGAAGEEARAHLAACAVCTEALEALRARGSAVEAALSSLDEQWDVESTRARVRQRVAAACAVAAGGQSAVRRRPRVALWSLSRAAGLLLVTAAAVSALPGSPVRAWLGARFGGDQGAATVPPPAIEGTPAAALAPESTGVRLSVPSGPLRVVLHDVAPGTDVRVRLVPGTEASVYAPAGSRFTSAAGRVEARVTPGAVRVELPTGVDPVVLEVGGRIYLRSTEAGLEVPGPVVTRTEDEVLFRIPG